MSNIQYIRNSLVDAAEVSLSPDDSVLKAIERIERSYAKIGLIVDAQGKPIGSVTDGDIRRGLLKGCTLESPVKDIMHANPYALPVTTPRLQIIDMMQSMDVKQIPLLNSNGTIAGIAIYSRLIGLTHAPRNNKVVIMAGGKGRRLLPITSDIPKPMIEVGGKPILEWIVQRFLQQGFHDFTFAINYLGHMIEDYFGNGSRFSCKIEYLREKEFLGTAGALSLLPKNIKEPLVVMNGDILANVDFGEVIDYHVTHNAAATVCARQHRVEVPYGVIQTKNGLLKNIIEKPVYDDLISAGMYVINPEIIAQVPQKQAVDMPGVLLDAVHRNQKVAVFAIRDEWVDIGRHDDLEQVKMLAAGK